MPTSGNMALPPEAPLDMPRQPLHRRGAALKGRRSWPKRARLAFTRLALLTFTAALSAYGVYEMYKVVNTGGMVALQWIFLVLFGINFTWISLTAAQSIFGFIRMLLMDTGLIRPPVVAPLPTQKVAILMPVYNESPEHVAASLKAMCDELITKAPGLFDVFILSDTNRPENWIHEERVFRKLIKGSSAQCPVYYRHRRINSERKAGNISDWVERWGGAYESMIVLDADSLLGCDVILKLATRLEASPEMGLIQTLPAIINGQTVYARLQQFANRCYGPIFGNGLATWHGLSSNFWGHNAIIRTRAFAESAKLPVLKGQPPFGGHILSHDFIEAAMLRRSGWGVRIDTDLTETYEEAPPGLTDVLIRDRRWCQGNLQHSRLLFARGLALNSRLHLLTGIMAYLSAFFWFSLVIVGLALALQAALTMPTYFAKSSLFPTWPVFDTERAITLFVVSMVVLLIPKILGWLAAMLNLKRCMSFGGPLFLTLGVLTEVLLSALFAPVMMIGQTVIVRQVLMGEDSGWKPQRRQDGSIAFSSALHQHYGHMLMGVAMAVIAGILNPDLFWWMLPVTGGLIISPLLSMLSGSAGIGKLLRTLRLLITPEERTPPVILEKIEIPSSLIDPNPKETISQLVSQTRLLRWHCAQFPKTKNHREREAFDPGLILAKAKMERCRSLSELEAMLTPAESTALLHNPVLLRILARTRTREMQLEAD